MQDADGLASARVDGCSGADKVVADFQKFDTEMGSKVLIGKISPFGSNAGLS